MPAPACNPPNRHGRKGPTMAGLQGQENQWPESAAAAESAIASFMAALNDRDSDAVYGLLHLPHIRISGEGVAIWRDRVELEATYLRDFYARAGNDWHHTVLDFAQTLHSSEHKVHVLIQFTRCDADGNAISTYRSLWIMTCVNGHWGAQARSSFAP